MSVSNTRQPKVCINLDVGLGLSERSRCVVIPAVTCNERKGTNVPTYAFGVRNLTEKSFLKARAKIMSNRWHQDSQANAIKPAATEKSAKMQKALAPQYSDWSVAVFAHDVESTILDCLDTIRSQIVD
ncbi:MAG: hypothetical protein WBM97_20280, partial [Sedimenticolaceae bacterium]